jgi:acylphosphatase
LTATPSIARRVTVRGEVQGVFFRDSCRRAAVERGVRGWVRNERDGSVQAWFEGPADDVEAMVRWCRHGPPRAQVEGVEVETVEPGSPHGFEVR